MLLVAAAAEQLQWSNGGLRIPICNLFGHKSASANHHSHTFRFSFFYGRLIKYFPTKCSSLELEIPLTVYPNKDLNASLCEKYANHSV